MKSEHNIRNRQKGFSLVELLVVMAIIIIVSAMAIPNIINAVRAARLRSAGSEVAGFLEQVRMTAVRENKTIYIRNSVVNGATMWYADRPDAAGAHNLTLDAGEPVIGMSPTLSIANTGAPAATAAMTAYNPNGSAFTQLKTMTDGTASSTVEMGFNSRGLPCQVVASGACNRLSGAGVPTNMIAYMQNEASGYAAVTVSGNGKVKIWVWDGVAYE
jgi:type IV fimbrial biogenesis protein FimT